MFESFAYAADAAPAPGAAAGFLSTFLPLIVIFAIFYFLLIRPQQKRMKDQQKMLDSLQKGDTVITTAGIYGRILKIDEKGVVTLDCGEKVRLKVNRRAISEKVDASTLEDQS